MTPSFINGTVRSASDLLADLQDCRVLRHLLDSERAAIIGRCFSDAKGFGRIYVRTTDAFAMAFERHGYSCDTCQEISEVSEDRLRYAADRALANLDGRVMLLLCKGCSTKFHSFCRREFNREARDRYTQETESMMLAWIAHEVHRHAIRIERAA